MRKKIMGMLMLLLLFTLKSAPLFMLHNSDNEIVNYSTQDTEDHNESDKEGKQLTEQEYIHQPELDLKPFMLSKSFIPVAFQKTISVYLSLPNPPPNPLS